MRNAGSGSLGPISSAARRPAPPVDPGDSLVSAPTRRSGHDSAAQSHAPRNNRYREKLVPRNRFMCCPTLQYNDYSKTANNGQSTLANTAQPRARNPTSNQPHLRFQQILRKPGRYRTETRSPPARHPRNHREARFDRAGQRERNRPCELPLSHIPPGPRCSLPRTASPQRESGRPRGAGLERAGRPSPVRSPVVTIILRAVVLPRQFFRDVVLRGEQLIAGIVDPCAQCRHRSGDQTGPQVGQAVLDARWRLRVSAAFDQTVPEQAVQRHVPTR